MNDTSKNTLLVIIGITLLDFGLFFYVPARINKDALDFLFLVMINIGIGCLVWAR